jgi:cell division inhibitor SepF
MPMFRTAMVWLGLVDDDEYDGDDEQYYLDDEYDEPADAAPAPTPRVAAARPAPTENSPVTVFRGRHSRTEAEAPVATVPRPSAVRAIPMPTAQVYVMDPRGFNDAQEVGDRLKNGQPVILNLQGVDRDLQRRLIDFASGLAYALSGTMSKAADQVFLLTPSNAEITDEEKERLQARGLYRASHL